MALATNEYKRTFMASEDAGTIRLELERMVTDPSYVTKTFYSPLNSDISFVDKHLTYLSEHPKLKSSEYLANLRLMTKARK